MIKKKVEANKKLKMYGIKNTAAFWPSLLNDRLSDLFNTSALSFYSLFLSLFKEQQPFSVLLLNGSSKFSTLSASSSSAPEKEGLMLDYLIMSAQHLATWLKPDNWRWLSVMVTKFRASWRCFIFKLTALYYSPSCTYIHATNMCSKIVRNSCQV